MSKNLNQAADALRAVREELARKHGQRAQAIAASTPAALASIDDLRRQRAEALGAAFLTNDRGPVEALDTAIEAATAEHATELARVESARAAVDLLQGQIAELAVQEAQAIKDLHEVALAEEWERFNAKLDEYQAAVSKLSAAIEELSVSGSVCSLLFSTVRCGEGIAAARVGYIRRVARAVVHIGGEWVERNLTPMTETATRARIAQRHGELTSLGLDLDRRPASEPQQPMAEPVVTVSTVQGGVKTLIMVGTAGELA